MDSCSQTTTADWVFSLTLASGTVALFAGVVWGIVVARSDPAPASEPAPTLTSAPEPARSRWTWLKLLAVSFIAYNLGAHAEVWWTGDHEALISSASLALLAFPLVGLALMYRRFTQTGHWPRGRHAPLGMFWLLPVLVLSAVLTCAWTVYAQIASMVPC